MQKGGGGNTALKRQKKKKKQQKTGVSTVHFNADNLAETGLNARTYLRTRFLPTANKHS